MKKDPLVVTVLAGLAGLLSVLVSLGLLFICVAGVITSSLFRNYCPLSEPRSIELRGQFTLPPGARNLESDCLLLGQGYVASAQFDMDPADLQIFQDSASLDEPLLEDEMPQDVRFPDGVELSHYLFGETREGSFRRRVWIDISREDIYTVYIDVQGE